MKKVFLTSALCMLCALPSYADIASNASSATCDSGTIGATEGSTGLEAQWTAMQYSENPGYYLLFANDTVSTNQTCTAGNYCPGFTNQTFADATMGLNSCASNNANFPNSDAGASAATDCYRTCNMANMGTESGKTIAPIAHATAISGKDYYGAGVDTCVPTSCDPGYHVANGPNPLTSYADTNASTVRYSKLDGTETQTGLNDGEWDVTWSDGTVVKGTSACTTTSGSESPRTTLASNAFTAGDYGTESSGGKQYCWCHMESYTLPNSATQSVTSSLWIFRNDDNYGAYCANNCAYNCANYVRYNSGFRSTMLGDVAVSGAPSCVANTIGLTWYSDDTDLNLSPSQCTYGETFNLPTQPTKPGYTFGGWTVKTSNNQ